jgi:hypothetical protein
VVCVCCVCVCVTSLVVSRLLYGAEVWNLPLACRKRLTKFYNSCVRKLAGVDRWLMWQHHISDAELRARCGLPGLEESLDRTCLRWAGHCARMEVSTRIPAQIFRGYIEEWGAPHRRGMFSERVLRALRRFSIPPESFDSLVQDRRAWAARLRAATWTRARRTAPAARLSSDDSEGNGSSTDSESSSSSVSDSDSESSSDQHSSAATESPSTDSSLSGAPCPPTSGARAPVALDVLPPQPPARPPRRWNDLFSTIIARIVSATGANQRAAILKYLELNRDERATIAALLPPPPQPWRERPPSPQRTTVSARRASAPSPDRVAQPGVLRRLGCYPSSRAHTHHHPRLRERGPAPPRFAQTRVSRNVRYPQVPGNQHQLSKQNRAPRHGESRGRGATGHGSLRPLTR